MATSVVATAYGGPEVLSVISEDLGPPGPGHVQIDVRAIGTNPIDYKIYSGLRGTDPSNLPIHIGFEASGIITAVGEGAIGPAGPVSPGDEVIAYQVIGAYSTEINAPASSIVPKPSALSFEEASGLMLTGATAIHGLTVTGIGEHDTVLVHGASGGVGLMAAQIALLGGARVIGTASQERHAYLEELGVEPTTYGEGLIDRVKAIAPDGVDAAIDSVGTDEAIDVSIALVEERSRIVTIAAFARGLELGIKVIGAAPGADPGTEIRSAARLELARLAGSGRLKVLVVATYPLSEAAVAHRELAGGHTHGKIVLIP